MKTGFILAALGLVGLSASSAYAIKVTNLDRETHRVAFDSAGSRLVETIPPGRTAFFPEADGTASLLTADPRKPSTGTLHDDNGLLHGFIGAERTEDIPVSAYDELVIWNSGEMSIQRRFKLYDR
ncbi:MAG: hypothetical protein WDN72_01725 [Alphaproteobacteria bacterium]